VYNFFFHTQLPNGPTTPSRNRQSQAVGPVGGNSAASESLVALVEALARHAARTAAGAHRSRAIHTDSATAPVDRRRL